MSRRSHDHRRPIAKISDVARLAGVGNATVSRALNGGKGVSADKLTRILEAVRTLDYRPNRAARSLKGAASGIIGMLVPSIADIFFSQCAEVIESEIRTRGCLLLVVAFHDDQSLFIEGLRRLQLQNPDGLVLANSLPHTPALLDALDAAPMPIVAIDAPLSDAGRDSVICANFEGGRLATSHLLEHGYRTVVSVQVKPHLYTMSERRRGYRDALARTGLTPVEEDIDSREDAVDLLQRLLPDTASSAASSPSSPENGASLARGSLRPLAPVALFAGNNLTARYICEAANLLGISVPDQLALLSFDDFELADTLHSPMSVIQQPIPAIGRSAATLLLELIDAGNTPTSEPPAEPPPAQLIQLPPQLILRASCGCHAPASTPAHDHDTAHRAPAL